LPRWPQGQGRIVETSWTWSPSSASASARSVAGRSAGRSSRISVPPAARAISRATAFGVSPSPGTRTGRGVAAGGSSLGRHRASSVFPAPAGPISIRLWPPAAATSSARFAASWPQTSARSVTTRRAP
jgi:hypothetical protein